MIATSCLKTRQSMMLWMLGFIVPGKQRCNSSLFRYIRRLARMSWDETLSTEYSDQFSNDWQPSMHLHAFQKRQHWTVSNVEKEKGPVMVVYLNQVNKIERLPMSFKHLFCALNARAFHRVGCCCDLLEMSHCWYLHNTFLLIHCSYEWDAWLWFLILRLWRPLFDGIPT